MKAFLLGSLLGVVGAIITVALVTRLLALTIPGASVTSWWRSWFKNQNLEGSATFSAHLLGWAVDLVPNTPEVEAAARERYPYVFPESEHIHAAVFKA